MNAQTTSFHNGSRAPEMIGWVSCKKPALGLPVGHFWTAALVLAALLHPCSAKADNIAYATLPGGDFGTLDLDTGAYSFLGNSGVTLAGLAVENGTLYGVDFHVLSGGTLYAANPTNGSLSAVGTSTTIYDDFGGTAGGLFAVDSFANLYSINSATGATTLIGATGILHFGSWRCLSSGATNLYFANGSDLYAVDTNTGTASPVGNMGGPEISTMVMEGGILYGGQTVPGLQVDTLDPMTGAATAGAMVTGTSDAVFGLAPYPLPTPLPTMRSLTISNTGNSVVVAWPSSGNFTLQLSRDLAAAGGWATNTYTIVTNGNGTNSITIAPATGSLFFRLANP